MVTASVPFNLVNSQQMLNSELSGLVRDSQIELRRIQHSDYLTRSHDLGLEDIVGRTWRETSMERGIRELY